MGCFLHQRLTLATSAPGLSREAQDVASEHTALTLRRNYWYNGSDDFSTQ